MSEQQPESKLDALIRQLRPALWHIGAVSFFINLLMLPISLYSLQIFDRVLSTGSYATLIWLTLTMILLFVAAGFLHSMRGFMLQRLGDWVYEEIAQYCLPRVLAQASTTGAKGAQSIRDAEIIKQFFSGPSLVTLMDAPWAVLFIGVLFMVHYALGFLVLVGATALLFLAWINESMMRDPIRLASTQQLQNVQELEFATRNADVIEAMGMGATLISRWKAVQHRTSSLQDIAHTRSSMVQGVTKFVRLSLQILVSGAAAWLVLEGQITIGAITASSILSGRALAPFDSVIGSWKVLGATQLAFMRIKIVLNSPMRPENLSPAKPQGFIEVENLTYNPPETEPVVQDVSFMVAAGEALGIVGPSGSGKTTLARLIAGILRPTNGIVRLDHADVYTWPRDAFGKCVGYLPQDVELFDGTVKENIARLQADASDADITIAAELANAHEFIFHLQKGYETQIGIGGCRLSAGQRQRIGLARALYGKPCLIVLDEPESNLDDAGRLALIAALGHAKEQRITAIVVTHQRSLLRYVDKILVMKDGKVDAHGPTEEILVAYGNPPPATAGTPKSGAAS